MTRPMPRPLVADDLPQVLALNKEAFGDFPAGWTPPDPADHPPPGRHSWGTFDGGVLVAKVVRREYDSWFHGRQVPTNGIAGVAVSRGAPRPGTARRPDGRGPRGRTPRARRGRLHPLRDGAGDLPPLRLRAGLLPRHGRDPDLPAGLRASPAGHQDPSRHRGRLRRRTPRLRDLGRRAERTADPHRGLVPGRCGRVHRRLHGRDARRGRRRGRRLRRVEPRLRLRRHRDGRDRGSGRPDPRCQPGPVAPVRLLRDGDRPRPPAHLGPRLGPPGAAVRRLAGGAQPPLHAARPRRRRRLLRSAPGRVAHLLRRRRPARHHERPLVADCLRRRLDLCGRDRRWPDLRTAWPRPVLRRRRVLRRPADGRPAHGWFARGRPATRHAVRRPAAPHPRFLLVTPPRRARARRTARPRRRHRSATAPTACRPAGRRDR